MESRRDFLKKAAVAAAGLTIYNRQNEMRAV